MRAKSFLLVTGFCVLLGVRAALADPAVGQPAPALTTPTLDGKNFDLSALKDKVVIVHFWATWCAPCQQEMPALEAVYRHYHGKGLEVLAVSADRPRARGDVDQVMHYFSFPASMLNAAGKNDFGVPGVIPVTYIIGKDGNLAGILRPDSAPLTEAALGDQVKSLLDAKPADSKPADKPADAKTESKP